MVSGDGSVLAGLARSAAGYDTFRWTATTGIVPLGTVSIGLTVPNPRAMTPDGQIMVGSAAFAAFVWRNGAGPENLQEVLEQRYGLNLGGFELFSAEGMSDDGRTIVGWGSAPSGLTTGWMVQLPWSIPTPGSACVLLMAGATAWRRRRR